jgi:hypothetical protein
MYALVRTVLLSVIISGPKVHSPHRRDSHMHSRNEGKERRGGEEGDLPCGGEVCVSGEEVPSVLTDVSV